MANNVTIELAKLLIANGIDLTQLTAAAAALKNPAAPEAPAAQKRSYTPPKPVYGKAPVFRAQPAATHKARLDALEAALPGFTKVAYVFSVGKDAAGKMEKRLNFMANDPWTWIELPNTPLCGKSAEDVRKTLASLGYGWSPANKLWACDSNGNPVRKTRGYRAKGAGRAMLNNED